MSRVLIIGLDGATFDLLGPWAAAGRLPNLARLMREGTAGEMASTIPPVTAPAFTSFMTGKNPGKTGIFHFIEPRPGSYQTRYINAASRRSPSIWKLLSAAGHSVGVIDVPVTYPPEPVDGYIIAGTDTPDDDSTTTYPPDLHRRLAAVLGDEYLRFSSSITGIQKGPRAFLEHELAAVDGRTRLALHLMRERPTAVTMVYYKATDHVQHLFWHYMDPAHPRHPRGGPGEFGDAILRAYQRADEAIGRLLDEAPAGTDVIVMSDHGFGPSSPTIVYLNRYFARVGLLAFRRSPLGAVDPRRLLHLVARRWHLALQGLLPPAVKIALSRRFPRARGRLDFHRTILAAIDWTRTRAYCTEVMTTLAPGIWVNLAGRQPQGCVPPERYDEVIQAVLAQLAALTDPVSGRPVVRRVYRRDEVYHGPYVHLAPDLMPAWWEEDGFVCRPSARGRAVVEHESGATMLPTDWSGTHRLHGIFIGRGPSFRAGGRLQCRLIDLAPTILHLMGLPVPEDMDGRVLVEALDGAPAARPVTSRPAASEEDGAGPAAGGYSDDEARKIEERLRDLGYVE